MMKCITHSSTVATLALAASLNACTAERSLPLTQPAASNRVVPTIALPAFSRVLREAQLRIVPPNDNNSAASTSFIYTAQLYGNDAKIYRQKDSAITFLEALTQGLASPQGTVATINGWWYIANAGNSNVLIYRSTKSGPQGPISSLDDYGQFPGNVSVTPSRRLVAVSNISNTAGGPGSVSVYLNREAVPARVLTYGIDPLAGIGVAVDVAGNCYWSFNDSRTNSGSIVEFVNCNGTGVVAVPAIAYAGGLTFDQHGNLYYVDQMSGIYKCQHTSNCSLFASGFGTPLNVNFDHKQKHLWVSDLSGYIDAVDPTTGQIESSTPAQGGSSDPPFGIAAAGG